MGNFVKLNTALPTPKVDANPPRGLPNELDAADINNLWNALADVRSGLTTDAIFKLAATGAISRSLFAKLADLISINDFGIGDPTAVINVLESGRVSQLPYIEPFAWWRADQVLGIQSASAFLGEKQEASSIVRTTSNATNVVAGVESTAPATTFRFQDNPPGLLIEPARTNLISVPDAPVSQAGLAVGSAAANYYLRVEGTGSIAVASATGVQAGLPLTVTASSPGSFTATGAGTVNLTVTGSVTFAQLEGSAANSTGGIAPTSRIHGTTVRQADAVAFANVLRNGRDWIVAIRAQPSGGYSWGPGTDDRGLFLIGDSTGVANTAFGYLAGSDSSFRFQINDAANATRAVSSAKVFLGTIEHDFWFYGSADGKMEIWVDGQRVALAVSGAGTGFITTMPANLRPGSASFTYLNGVAKDFKIFYDTPPERLPKPLWTRSTVASTAVCVGDSITAGTGSTTSTYPATLQTTLSSGTTGAWSVLNAGVGGDMTWQTLARWGAGVRRQTQKYVVLFSGTNDLANGLQATAAWNNLTRIATQVRSDGKSLVLVTILPRTPFSATTNAERVKLNASIMAYCAAGGATCVNASPDFDNGDGTTLKVAYDSGDGIHPNQAGHDHLAALVAAAIPH